MMHRKITISDVLMVGFIVIAGYSHGRILQISLQTGSLLKLPVTVHSPAGIAFDKSTKTLFYSDIKTNTIMSTSLHGKGTTLLYSTGFAFASKLAIDYSTGNLYYTAVASGTSRHYIGSVHRNSSLHKTILSTEQIPRAIVLYPSKGFLFWSEWGTASAIRRAYMDGTNTTYIATKNLTVPNGLAIDFTTNILYWVDGGTHRVEFSNLDGGNRQVLTTITKGHLYSIGIHGQYLYYSGWNRPVITKMDKNTGSIVPFMSHHPELGRLDGMDIYADDTVDVSPICSTNNGRCSTFCFPTSSGRTCGCQDNVHLQPDQLTCQGVILCPSSLENGVLSPDCLRRSGDSCSFTCVKGYAPSTTDELLCTTEGVWNNDTTKLCSKITPNQKKEANTENKTSLYVYVGAAVGCLLVIIIILVAVIILLKRRNNGRENGGGSDGPLDNIFTLSGKNDSELEHDYCTVSL